MKCPNCGSVIPEGKLICEGCGCELEIVTDLEFDVDKEMEKTLSQIAENEFADEYDIEFDEDPNLISMIIGAAKGGKAFYVLFAFILVLIIAIAVIIGKKISSQNSYEYQLELAEENLSENNILGAIKALEAAYKIEPSAEIMFDIADHYYSLGRINDAISALYEITEGKFPNDDICEAYRKIISLYNEDSNYEKIASILSTCENETILKEYKDYCVFEPSFNVKEGTYDETITVKLSTEGNGNIYYTTDGSEPTSASEEFSTPIFLEYGKYKIKAVYINKFGVKSEIAEANYLIDVDFVFKPDILTESGTYTEATLIEAEVPMMYTLYYTFDGSTPDKNSTRYISPIPMKMGEWTYKFIMYASDGTESSIEERTYKYEPPVTFSPAEAVQALSSALIEKGYYTGGATKVGDNRHMLLMYSDLYPIPDVGNFYFVVEYGEDENGVRNTTGVVYAVDCNDLSVYFVNVVGNGNYTLREL